MDISKALRIIERERDNARRTFNALPPSGRRNATALKELIEAYETAITEFKKAATK